MDGRTDRIEAVKSDAISSPATTAQEFFWTLAQLDPDPRAYYMTAPCLVRGALDARALQRSFATLVDAHSVFRTALRDVDGDLRQILLPPAEAPRYELELEDRSTAAADVDQEIARTIGELVSRDFDLQRGRVLWARLVKLAADQHALVIVFHHVAVDFRASNTFMKRLWALYYAARAGDPAVAAPSLQYIDFTEAHARWTATPTGAAARTHARELMANAPAMILPTDLPREDLERRHAAAPRGMTADLMHPAMNAIVDNDVREAVTLAAR
jgi:hypothetical protein